jgi:hypothetical protein
VHITPETGFAARVGIVCLLFLVGFKADLSRLAGPALKLGAAGWLLSLGIGLTIGASLHAGGVAGPVVPFALAMSTTAFGALLPMLQRSGLLATPAGPFLVAAGVAGEVGPITGVALVFSERPGFTALLLALFVCVCAGIVLFARRRRSLPHAPVRRSRRRDGAAWPAGVGLLVLLIASAATIGLSALLVAFMTGFTTRAIIGPATVQGLRRGFDAAGFGLLVAMFPIVTGARIDVRMVTASPLMPLAIGGLVLAFIAVRGTPVFLFGRALAPRDRLGLACLSAAQLPLVTVITTAAVTAGEMSHSIATAFLVAGVTSLLVLPRLGLGLSRRAVGRSGLHTHVLDLPLAASTPAAFVSASRTANGQEES